ncbi:34999_t:CDS:2 [Gigaspora margarita]|uniref:34999_t:CDS:1 n=1 Tax=Gigaspora margarita TaxID=4874 RepID=A0ABN7WDB3_GIGMA|nr:34999_t:CDS:2 [Gigaspora margarita]
MEERKYQGKVIKKELLFSSNYKLTIQTTEGKIRFLFFDGQKNGGKYYFLDKIEVVGKEIETNPEITEALSKRKTEIEEFQINQLIRKYKIKDLEQLEARANQLKHDIKGIEY